MVPKLAPALVRYLREAPPESPVAVARRFGIDVAAVAFRLETTTPWERLRELDRRIEDVARLRRRKP